MWKLMNFTNFQLKILNNFFLSPTVFSIYSIQIVDAYCALAQHPEIPVVSMDIQSRSPETFGLKMMQVLDMTFCTACIMNSRK
jgi:hypothetical protein